MGAWGLLAVAIAFEIAGTALLKLSDGFARPLIGATALLAYGACFAALAPAMRVIPVGVAYAVWSGVGITAIAIIGLLFFQQKLSALQIIFILMIIVGAVGLRLIGEE